VETRAENFPLFDALRGLAALFVLTYHGLYQPATYAGQGSSWWRYAIHLDVAVPIFLGISGFLLYRPFAAARLRGQPVPRLTAYGWRRFLRIVPGYWFALVVLTLWFWANPPGFEEVRSLRGVLTYFGFAQIYDSATAIHGIGQAWTLGVEVVFYLALPLWVVLMHRLRREGLGLALLVVLSIGWKVFVLSRVDPASRDSLSAILPMPTWIDHFAMGMLLALWSVRRPEGPPRVWPAWPAAVALWLAACWLAGPSGAPDDPVTDGVYLLRHVLYTGVVFCLLIPAVWGRTDRGLLTWRPLGYVGLISFSFYLFHFAWIRQQARWWGDTPSTVFEWAVWMAALLAGSLVLGSIGYHLVERPAMRLKRLVPARRADQPGAASTPAAPA
jgi:peptidoglycan/LPS O-acetylase OafA/YrhL